MAKNNKLINSLNEIARRNRSQNVATAADQMVPFEIVTEYTLEKHGKAQIGRASCRERVCLYV